MRASPPIDLDDLARKVEAGERLGFEDGVRLFRGCDIHTLGELANRVRERLHGRNTYYNINRHINYSNVCVLRCKFCSFYRPYPADERIAPVEPQAQTFSADGALPILGQGRPAPMLEAYQLSIEEIVRRSREAAQAGATEVHIVGGLHPKLPFEYYEDMCSAILAACPNLHIKAFTAIEIIHLSRISKPRRTITEVLERLRDAGLGSLPGGGAEIFNEKVHDAGYKHKVGEAGWFDVHRVAHELGIFSNATMLYGHIETPEDRVRHLLKLRDHQDASLAQRAAHFNCIIPLSFIPAGSAWADLPGPTGLDDLRTLAAARLLCDNIAHVKSFWIMHSPKLAQVALNWGVDDIDGTVVWYDITKGQGQGTHQELSVAKLQRLITEAGCIPVERDTLYRPVRPPVPTA